MENEVEIFAKVSPKQSNNGHSSSRLSPRDGGVSKRARSNRPRETEEEAIIRRFHDAQRMARFRARKKKALEDQQQLQQQQLQIQQLEANGITVRRNGRDGSVSESESRPESNSPDTESKYSQLLAIIERIGRDVRLSYAGSRSSAERLKSGIVRARSLVRDCLLETSLNLRQ